MNAVPESSSSSATGAGTTPATEKDVFNTEDDGVMSGDDCCVEGEEDKPSDCDEEVTEDVEVGE